MISVRTAGRVKCVSALLACLAIADLAWAQSSVPSPWSARDIGNPAIAGSASFNSGAFRIDAAGTDIWGTSDQFYFVYQAFSGDVEIIARVDTLTTTHAWSKTGVMIRSALTASAAHGFAVVSARNGSAFQRRLQSGGASTHTAGSTSGAPQWVRLVRAGTTITAYRSTSGTSWTVIGSDTIALGATAYVGLATTSHNASLPTSADLSQVTVRAPGATPLPSPQKAQDIGGPGIAGSTAYSSGSYTVKAGGTDIWGTADQFHYVYQPVSGDVDVVARVASITNTHDRAKAGVMVRESLTAGSRNAAAVLNAGRGYGFQSRIDTNGYTTRTPPGTGSAPGWVRLVRTGDRFEAFRSTDGQAWTPIGSDTVPMAAAVYVGIAVTSHNTAAATTAVLDSLSIAAGTGGNQSPTVTLTSPANGAIYTAPATIAMSATAGDTDGTIARVDFFRGGTLVTSDSSAPYSATWSSAPAGTCSLTAVAVDNEGGSTTSDAVTVTVNSAGNQPPTVTLTSPASGAPPYTAPATIAMTATAGDTDGAIARVDFFRGGTLVTSDSSAPYSATWSSAPAGTYSLTAVAVDNAGASTTSTAVSVTVNAAGNQAPTVTLTSPANGATYTAPATIAMSATASDSDGTIARVDFFRGGTLVTSDSSAPYSATWSSAPAGTYSLTAVAVDNGGASKTSTAVTVTVGAASTPPTTVIFQASADHASMVTSYRLDVFASGANPNTATPVAASDLGKPTPAANNDITVNRASFFSALTPGNYIATVSAIGSGGSSRSASVAFTR